MIRRVSLQSLGLLVIGLSPLTMGFIPVPSPSEIPSAIALKFPETGNRGKPKQSAGGGVRGDQDNCITPNTDEISLAAIMPNRDNTGKTTLANPQLLIFISQTKAKSGELVITDGTNREVYFAAYSLPQQPGIIQVTIPAKATLKPNQTYNWTFMVVCNPDYRNYDHFIKGQITYTEPNSDLQKQLQGYSPLEKAEKYAESGLWFETVVFLKEIRRTDPKQWQERWRELLQSVGLENLANYPLLDCCTAKNQ
jgi:hypothetical protein